MRTTLGTAAALALLAGCTVTDENPGWSPRQDYPAWAYDAPYYCRPSEELEVAEVVAGGELAPSPQSVRGPNRLDLTAARELHIPGALV